jgi:hypothetical protein
VSNLSRFFCFCLLGAPLLAQTQIGGGTCNSSSLNGTYALSLTGRAVSATGTFTNALQGNGSATFDGLKSAGPWTGREPIAWSPTARQW